MSAHTIQPNSRWPAGFRELRRNERELLNALLAQEFPGHNALSGQLASARARTIVDNPSLDLQVKGGLAADVERRIPIEAEVEDADGVSVHILLHVVDGFMKELEIYREDSRPLMRPVDLSRLRFLIL